MSYTPLDRDNEPTLIKPTPGGRRPGMPLRPPPPEADAPYPSLTAAAPAPETASTTYGMPPAAWGGAPPREIGLNPVCAAATPLLNLGRRLRGSASQPDVEGLRRRVIDEMRTFERDILAAGTPPEQARAAHYALCATLDDLALNTPWGAYSSWARQGLVSTFHVDVTGGERFFDLLTFLHKDPGANRDVLALMYLCLSVGFEGRLRVVPQGALELSRIRESLYSTLRQVYGDFERELSPRWRGEDARHLPLRTSSTLSLIASLTALALLLGYFALNTSLGRQSDATLQRIAAAAPNGDVAIDVSQPAPRPEVAGATIEALRRALADDIAAGRVELAKKDTMLIVRISNAGMFASGSADLAPAYRPMIERIGHAVADTGGRVRVVGNTDNVPYHDPRYRSNQGLSEARAQAVAAVIGQAVPRERIDTEGRADTDPVASNATDAGRQKNRRTDLEMSQLAVSVAGTPEPVPTAPVAEPAPVPVRRLVPPPPIAPPGPIMPTAPVTKPR